MKLCISRWTKNSITLKIDKESKFETKVIDGENANEAMSKFRTLQNENDLAKYTPWNIDDIWD
jgi:hypothetical protein